ncbi:MAG TPA: hypothetical protein VFJ43_11790, partial [Bacteroidia bacterium]|nr:hypothetical protein [Bacteroidia bacterium]
GHSFIFQREDGIIEIDCSDNFEYGIEHIKENLAQIKKMAGNKKVLVLNCSKPFTTVTKEVRDYVASAPHKDFIKGEAFVIHTIGQAILGNFYLRVNKPIVPAKLFKNKTDAENWLRKL